MRPSSRPRPNTRQKPMSQSVWLKHVSETTFATSGKGLNAMMFEEEVRRDPSAKPIRAAFSQEEADLIQTCWALDETAQATGQYIASIKNRNHLIVMVILADVFLPERTQLWTIGSWGDYEYDAENAVKFIMSGHLARRQTVPRRGQGQRRGGDKPAWRFKC